MRSFRNSDIIITHEISKAYTKKTSLLGEYSPFSMAFKLRSASRTREEQKPPASKKSVHGEPYPVRGLVSRLDLG
jgi:hypothetical protein